MAVHEHFVVKEREAWKKNGWRIVHSMAQHWRPNPDSDSGSDDSSEYPEEEETAYLTDEIRDPEDRIDVMELLAHDMQQKLCLTRKEFCIVFSVFLVVVFFVIGPVEIVYAFIKFLFPSAFKPVHYVNGTAVHTPRLR